MKRELKEELKQKKRLWENKNIQTKKSCEKSLEKWQKNEKAHLMNKDI
jgi:hypothetical protein